MLAHRMESAREDGADRDVVLHLSPRGNSDLHRVTRPRFANSGTTPFRYSRSCSLSPTAFMPAVLSQRSCRSSTASARAISRQTGRNIYASGIHSCQRRLDGQRTKTPKCIQAGPSSTSPRRERIFRRRSLRALCAGGQPPIRVTYERRNRDIDPQLVWRGNDEQALSDLVAHAPVGAENVVRLESAAEAVKLGLRFPCCVFCCLC
jgi:hypothetical protein